jgi:hypothetical protein
VPFLLIWLTNNFYGLAQPTSNFIINKGKVVTQVIPIKEQYRFSEFEPGEVYFRNNTFGRATLNYNLLYGEMQFINHKGDTLSLKGEYKLKLITVGKHVFFYAHKVGYLEVVTNYPRVKLVKKQILELTRSQVPLKSYSVPAGIVTGNNELGIGSVLTGKDWKLQELYTQPTPGVLHFDKKETYIIVDKNDRFYEANKYTVNKLFPRHRKAISEYLKKYKPDFNLRNDLQGLLAFCSQLD